MNVETEAVVKKLTEQIGQLALENAMLSAALDAARAELGELKPEDA